MIRIANLEPPSEVLMKNLPTVDLLEKIIRPCASPPKKSWPEC